MNNSILPQGTDEALKRMILITQETIASFEHETNALALKNHLDFLQNAKLKQEMNMLYEYASREFMARKKEFFRYKSPLLQDLSDLQTRLKREILINMNFLEPMLNTVKVDKV